MNKLLSRNLLGVALIVFVDQLIKLIIRSKSGFYVCNSGIAFGINLSSVALGFLWGVLVVFLLYCYLQRRVTNGKCSVCSWCDSVYFYFILGGGISNLIDRIVFGCVIDYIDLGWFPVFNLADAFISIGAAMLILKVMRSEK
jgi:signal peptidase II